MAEMAVILRGLATLNEKDARGLGFTASPRGLILNKYRFYNIWWKRPCQLSGRMKNSSYYNPIVYGRDSNIRPIT